MTIENGTEIQIFTIPYFLASKWEAFKSRDALDFRGSSDFEDIVYVLENAENIEKELVNSPPQVKSYLKQELENGWMDTSSKKDYIAMWKEAVAQIRFLIL